MNEANETEPFVTNIQEKVLKYFMLLYNSSKWRLYEFLQIRYLLLL